MSTINIKLFLMLFIAGNISCTKYLDKKPDQKLNIPSTLNDLQSLLDNSYIMNLQGSDLGEVSADNYMLTEADFSSISAEDRNAYTWNSSIFLPNGFPNGWALTYDVVYYANVVLENIENISRTTANANAWDNIKGSAHLYRAKSFLKAAWLWSKAYDPASSSTDPGIPLRLNSDFNQPTSRANVEESYQQIIRDLKTAVTLLPTQPVHVMRPSKPAAYAFLARTYLSMREYDSCLKYANLCLQLRNELMDYNNFSPGFTVFSLFNEEVIMHSTMQYLYSNLYQWYARIDSELFNSYDNNDLRKTLFCADNFDGTYVFIGNYADFQLFDGIATDEVLLMRAECHARLNNKDEAINEINRLLEKRWVAGTFVPLIAANNDEALDIVLAERRKELIFRDLRWIDIKRFNKEGANIVLQRNIDGKTFVLVPNSDAYALPIPPDIISISGIEQNKR